MFGIDYVFLAWVVFVIIENFVNLQFFFDGVLLGNIVVVILVICEWVFFYVIWNLGGVIDVEICIINVNSEFIGNDFVFDDISFGLVCEVIVELIIIVGEMLDIVMDVVCEVGMNSIFLFWLFMMGVSIY